MSNKALSLLLGITLSLGGLGTETLASPDRIRFNPNAGVHRTIISPNTRTGNNHSNRGGGNYTFRERITIEREQQGSCYNCNHSHGSNPYHNYRGYGRNRRSSYNNGSYRYYR